MTHLARSTLIIAAFFGLEKALGFVRQVAIARTFGLSATLDAYNAANNIPDLLFYLISGGALAIAFIPVLSEQLEKDGRPAMWEVFSHLVNLVFITTATLSIVVALFAEQLVNWRLGVAPGFTAEQRVLVADLMRLNLLATLFLSLGGLVIGGLQANQHFLLPAMAPPMYDLGTLFGVLILVPETGYQLGPITLPAFGLGVHGLVYGTILGAALFLLVQVPGLFHYHFHWKAVINLRHPGVQKVLVLLGPRILTVFCIQLIYLAQDNIASRLAAGTVSALVYGWLFMQVPETLIGTAIGTALLPTISEQLVRGEYDAFRQFLSRTLRVILALTLPSAILLGLTLRPVIQILGFDQAGTDLVLWTSRAYLLGLIGHSVLEVVVRAFYAQQDARTPLVAAALTTAAFITLAIILAYPLGAPGIALANTLAFTGEALLLLYLLSRRFPGFLHLNGTPWRVAVGCTISAGLVWALLRLPLPALPLAAVALAAGGLVILPFIWPELKILMRL
jgi:putative peptidoglycan lipid II flippase